MNRKSYAVKSFLIDTRANTWAGIATENAVFKGDVKSLPYELVKAGISQDMWALGVMLALLTGKKLIPVDKNEDLASTEAYRELATWDDLKKKNKLCDIENPYAKELLMILLSENPSWLRCRCAGPQVLEGRLNVRRISGASEDNG